MKTFLNKSIITLFILFIFSSCTKGDDDDKCVPNTPTDKSVSVDFEFTVGGESFLYDEEYSINGTTVSFNDLRFYLSDFVLRDEVGTTEALNAFLLVDAGAGANTFELGTTELENLTGIDMLLGLNDVVNHEDPITAPAPLNDASMHWGWNPEAGYKFVKIECLVDSNADGTPDAPTAFHVATDALVKDIVIATDQTVELGTNTISLSLDIADCFENINLATAGISHGGNQINNTLATNMAESFTIEN